ncbi:hypothetical protein ACROYT_G008229 [Oculina patagonica]
MRGCYLLLVLIFLSSAVHEARGEELNCPMPILNDRIKELEAELASGQQLKQEQEEKLRTLTETMIRIQGALQVLREECGATDSEKRNDKA